MARKFFTGAIFNDEVQVNDGNNYVKISEGSNSIGQIELKDSASVFLQGWGTDFRVAVNGTYNNHALIINNAKHATFYGNVSLGDNKNLDFGAAPDFRIVHNSTTNVNHISSKLDRQLSLNANNVFITNQANTESMAKFFADAEVKLYYDNVQKFQTTSTGIEVSGTNSTFAGNIDAGSNSVTAGSFVGNLSGNVNGNVTGNLTNGTLSNISSLAVTGTSTFGGDVTANGNSRKIRIVNASNNEAVQLLSDSSGDGQLRLNDNLGTTRIFFYGESNNDNYINNGGNLGVGINTPYAFDTTTTKFHVRNVGSSGSVSEVARFEGSSDADGSGAVVRIGTSNDRGMYFQAGRTGTVPYAQIGTTEYNGAKTLALTLDNSGNTTFAGDVNFNGGEGAVKVIGSGNQSIQVGSTSGGFARIYLDGKNGDFSGSDYIYIGQNDDGAVHFYADTNAGTTVFSSKGVTNLTMDSANSTFAGDLTVSGGDITLGSDVSIFRDGVNILRTDDTFHANNDIHVGGTGKIYDRADTNTYVDFGGGSFHVNAHNVITSGHYLEFNAMGKLINMDVSGWSSGQDEHNILYSGWTSATGDYLSLKVAGNSTTAHGNLIIGDMGLWFGRMNTTTSAQATDSGTNPHTGSGSNYFRVNTSGRLQVSGDVVSPIYYDTAGTTNYLDLGNSSISLKVPGNIDLNSNKAVRLADRHSKLSFVLPSFTHGTSNLAVDLILGNTQLNGILELKLTSGYSNQNAVGEAYFKWIFGFNQNGSIWYTPCLVESNVTVQQASQIYVDDPAWDSTNSRYFIRIYHKVSSGNQWEGTLENTSQNKAAALVDNFSVGSLLTSTSTSNTHHHGKFLSDSSGSVALKVKQSVDTGFNSGLTVERSANTQKVHIGMDGGAVNFNSPDGLSYKFRNNGTEKFRVDGSGNVVIPSGSKYYLDGGTNTYITESSDGVMDFYGDGVQLLTAKQNGTQNEVVVNEGSGDVDFRVESNNSQHAFFVEAEGKGKVGIGDDNPDRKLSIKGDDSSEGQYPLSLDATNTDYTLEFRRNGTSQWWIKQSSSSFNIHENGVGDQLTIASGGNTNISGSVTASSFIKSGGTSSQFLMADGSVSTSSGSADNLGNHTATTTLNMGGNSITGIANIDLGSSRYIRWGAGDAQIEEGSTANYSLDFSTYDGSSMTKALTLLGNNDATFTGNVALGGGTLQTYHSNVTSVLALDDQTSLFTRADQLFLANNCFYNSSDTGVAIEAGKTSLVQLDRDKIRFYFTASATAGGTVSFQEKFRLDDSGNATFTGGVEVQDNLTLTKSSGNNQIYINSSGGGAPVIYFEDPNRKWGQFVSNGHLYFKDETANVTSLKIDGATAAATFAGNITAPKYFDSNNTAYFVNPASASNINSLTVGEVVTSDHIYGRSVNNQYSLLYRFGGLFLTWDSDSYGTQFNHSITSTDNGTYSDSITINSYDKVRINIDSNNNDSASTFSVGHHGTGSSGYLLHLDESGHHTVTGSSRAPIFYDSDDTTYFLNPASNSILNQVSFGVPGNGSNNKARFFAIEGNADGSGEGSGRIFFTEHNSTTAAMSKYGMSLGYRGGATSITGTDGNSWDGLSLIGNGEWGMWGHNNSARGALIMYGDRAGSFIKFDNNNLQEINTLTGTTSNFSGYQLNGTYVMDSSRNLVNIGTITTAGVATFNDGITLGGSNETLNLLYNNTSSYKGSIGWSWHQMGNNGSNDIVAGNTAVGGYLRFIVNNTNSCEADTNPNGTVALTISSDADATFTNNVTLGDALTDKAIVHGHFGIGHDPYPKIAYPGQNALWGGSGSTTGQIVIDLPGTLNNYDMMYMEIDIYEYSGDAATKLIVGGHNWNSGGNSNTSTTQWYNVNVQVLGRLTKPVYVGRRNDGSNERRCIAIGETTSTWSYATVHVSKVHGAEFYGTAIDWVGDWNIAQTTSTSYFTKNPTTNFNDGGSQTFETNGIGEANHWFGSTSVRSPIFYDLDNTAFYTNPAGTSVVNHMDMDSGNVSGKFAVKSAAVHGSYDFYNDGTSYFNGAVIIDHNLDITNNGVIKMAGTEVISATRGISATTGTFSGNVLEKGKKHCTASISNSYVRVFAVSTESSQLATLVRVTGTAHGGSHVGAFTADIIVNHSQDVHIKSQSGNYTDGVIKVESDNNGQYTMSYKSGSANSATYYFTIEALSSEMTITTNPSSTSSTNTTHEHKLIFGTSMSGEGGSEPNLCFASNDGDTNVKLIRSGDGLQIKTGSSGQFTHEFHQNGSLYTKGLYDIDDSAYYLDPASSGSKMVNLNLISDGTHNTNDAALYVQRTGNEDWGVAVKGNSNATEYGIKVDLAGSSATMGYAYYSAGALKYLVGHNSAIHHGDMRSPIFYDSTNTSYYVDPGATTSLRTVGAWHANSHTWSGEQVGKIQYHSDYWYMQTTNGVFVRNASGANNVTLLSTGVCTANNDWRAPQFYDSADTSYVLDPNGNSNLYNLTLNDLTVNGTLTYGIINAGVLEIDGRKVLDMPNNSTERGPWNPIATFIRGSGTAVYGDEDFASGLNSVSVYNNAGGSVVTHTREDATTNSGGAAPNSSGKVIRINHNGGTSSPGFGGFVQTIPSADNQTFVQVFQAKLRVGSSLVIAENAQGSNNTSYFLTDSAGTGKWEWYVRVSHCGVSGNFHGGGHIYVTGGSGNFNWYLASCELYKVTDGRNKRASDFIATQSMTSPEVFVYNHVYHYGDTDTHLSFDPDIVKLTAGNGKSRLKLLPTEIQAGQEVGSNTQSYNTVLRLQGKNNYSNGTNWYGNYGQLIFSASTNMTSSARRYLFTNAYNNNHFAIVQSNDANTDPAVNTDGTGVRSGGLVITWNNSREVTMHENMYAPNYYDKDNTTRYVNPGGTSELGSINTNGGGINLSNGNISNANKLTFNDAGVAEGIQWNGGNVWQIYESPNNQTNAGGNLQFTSGSGNGTIRMTLDTSGNLTVSADVVAFSDERLKTNIETLDGSKVYEMRGVSYIKDDKQGSGVIAQELEKVAPELVNNDSEYKSVAYGNITGYLIEAIKDLKAEIEELKKQIK